MLAIAGTYENGVVKLDKKYNKKTPIKVIVTFIEDKEPQNKTRLRFEDFSFAKSRELFKNYTGTSFSDEVITERRG
jgi:hypothetical protein